MAIFNSFLWVYQAGYPNHWQWVLRSDCLSSRTTVFPTDIKWSRRFTHGPPWAVVKIRVPARGIFQHDMWADLFAGFVMVYAILL